MKNKIVGKVTIILDQRLCAYWPPCNLNLVKYLNFRNDSWTSEILVLLNIWFRVKVFIATSSSDYYKRSFYLKWYCQYVREYISVFEILWKYSVFQIRYGGVIGNQIELYKQQFVLGDAVLFQFMSFYFFIFEKLWFQSFARPRPVFRSYFQSTSLMHTSMITTYEQIDNWDLISIEYDCKLINAPDTVYDGMIRYRVSN